MKLNKTFTVLLVLAFTAALCLGSMTTALADVVEGTEANPVQAVITKELQMPEGTTTPVAAFTFQFAKQSVDGSTETADIEGMPAVSPQTVTFSNADVGTTASNIKTVQKDTASLFNDVIWPHAGIYIYTVTETANTYTEAAGETMSYSGGSYDIAVYVANGENETLYIAAISSTIVEIDNEDQTAGEKTDPVETGVESVYSVAAFTNQFVEINGGTDPTDSEDQTLTISKTVTGDYGNKAKYFEFAVTVTESALSTGETYKGYVVEESMNEDGESELVVVTSANNATLAGTDEFGGYINFPSGQTVTVNLKHGQTLVFVDTEVGASYVAVETLETGYSASVLVVENDVSYAGITSDEGDVTLSTNSRLIGEGENSATFTNAYQDVTPTGISIGNLPFVMMIVLAAGALTLFIIVKARKKAISSRH